jgi:Squalene-hopene cyclase C-terminal domain/Prenyltransferase and squalene oxidase repeat
MLRMHPAHMVLLLASVIAKADDSLVRAAAAGDIERVKALLRDGANPNAGTLYQMPPIAFALMGNNPEMFRVLADGGADLKSIPALFLAAYADTTDPGVIERLIHAGARVDGKGPRGNSLLASAIRSGNRTMARAAWRAGLSYEPLVREAVEKAAPPIEKAAVQFTRAAACASCHHAALPAIAVSAAKQAGIGIDEDLHGEILQSLTQPYSKRIDELRAGTAEVADGDTGVPFAMVAAAAGGQKRDATIAAMVQYMSHLQHPDGGWGTGARRPPIEGSAITATALNLRAFRLYDGPPDGIARAKAWLLRANPQSTEEQAMLLLGLVWVAADREAIERAAATLLAAQRPDGGWAETATLETDAYSTGESLLALRAAGALKPTDEGWLRGTDYLLRTQQDDGTWYVRSRSAAVQPFVDSGFPHGRNQFISMAGSCWAVMALLENIAPQISIR